MGDTAKDEQDRTGPVSDEEARQISRRYNASHFRNHTDLGEQARYSIPADPKRDDDIRLSAYIEQTAALRASLAEARGLLDRAARFDHHGVTECGSCGAMVSRCDLMGEGIPTSSPDYCPGIGARAWLARSPGETR